MNTKAVLLLPTATGKTGFPDNGYMAHRNATLVSATFHLRTLSVSS